jgi:hypothetical protein
MPARRNSAGVAVLPSMGYAAFTSRDSFGFISIDPGIFRLSIFIGDVA